MNSANLVIKTMPLSKLKGWNRNPRSISDEALNGLEASIKAFGLVEPVIWNERTGRVVGGHQRLKVLKRNNVKETDVVVVDMDESQEMACNVALNNPAIAGIFNEDITDILKEIEKNDEKLYQELKFDNLVLEKIDPQEEWQGMPDFKQEDLQSFKSVIVHFENIQALNEFSSLIGQKLTVNTKFIWYPKQNKLKTGTAYES